MTTTPGAGVLRGVRCFAIIFCRFYSTQIHYNHARFPVLYLRPWRVVINPGDFDKFPIFLFTEVYFHIYFDSVMYLPSRNLRHVFFF